MLASVQSFIRPTQASAYLFNAHQTVSRALDSNNDRVLSRDEVHISRHLARRLDTNRDGRLQVREMAEALRNNEVSLSDLDRRSAHQVARALLPVPVYAPALGGVSHLLDHNRDDQVSAQELGRALSSGQVSISGNFLVATTGGSHPGQPGHGVSLRDARDFVQEIANNKMKKDRWGNNDPSTGIFTPEEANRRIKEYLSQEVMSSERISMQDKFTLITENKMAKDRWGNYDNATGALKASEAADLAKIAIAEVNFNRRGSDARAALNAIAAQRQHADRWGNDDPTTGLLSPATANDAIKDLINNKVLNSRFVSRADKLGIIKDHAMSKDRWGNYDPRSGALSAQEVNRLSQKVFDMRDQGDDALGDDPFARDPFADQPNADPFGQDPFQN